MSDSHFYYGTFTAGDKDSFQLDLAYWFVMVACFTTSLVLIVRWVIS